MGREAGRRLRGLDRGRAPEGRGGARPVQTLRSAWTAIRAVDFRLLARRILLGCVTLLLLALAWGALAGGVRQLPGSTVDQQIQTVVQLVAGLLSLLVVLTCFAWRRWARPVRRAWAVSLAAAAGFSALVWGPPMPHIAALFAGLALLVAWGVDRALRTALTR